MTAVLIAVAVVLAATVYLSWHYGHIAEELAAERDRLADEHRQIDADWAALARGRAGACKTLAECLSTTSALEHARAECSYFEQAAMTHPERTQR